MGAFTTASRRCSCFLIALEVYLWIQTAFTLVCCSQYKVGDLDAWNVPTSANHNVYSSWSRNHIFQLGDSLFFLYPPSQDSVLQVTPQSYAICNLQDPILAMNDGNSHFNLTCAGELYFISGARGHCEQAQKLHISVPGNVSCPAFSPAYGPSIAAAASPSYPAASGPALPIQASSSSAAAAASFNSITHPISSIFAATILSLLF